MNMKKHTLAFVAVALTFGLTASTAFAQARDFGGTVKPVAGPSSLPTCTPANAGRTIYYVNATAAGSCSVAGSSANYCYCDGSNYILQTSAAGGLQPADAVLGNAVPRFDIGPDYGWAVIEEGFTGSTTLQPYFSAGTNCGTWTQTGEANAPGVRLADMGTGSATDSCYMTLGNQANLIRRADGDLVFEARVRIPVLAVATTADFAFTCGFSDATGSAYLATDGMQFIYDRITSLNWETTNSNGAARTRTAGTTPVPVVAGTWYKLGIKYVNDGTPTVDYYLNDVLYASYVTNAPASTTAYFSVVCTIVETVGDAAAAGFAYDYIYASQRLGTYR